jgi:hypothetical protein
MAPAESVECEVGGHLDDKVGADAGVCGAGCTPAVRGQAFGPSVGLPLEERAEPGCGRRPECGGAAGDAEPAGVVVAAEDQLLGSLERAGDAATAVAGLQSDAASSPR